MSNLWYFVKASTSEKVGPIGDEEFRRWVAEGRVAGNDLVWTEGLSDWTPLRALPPWTGITQTPAAMSGATEFAVPPGLLGWMTFVGVIHIVFGVLAILTCFGLINGIFMLICGTALLAAKNELQAKPLAWSTFLLKLRTFMQMTGMLYIFTIVNVLVVLMLFAHGIARGLSQVLQTAP